MKKHIISGLIAVSFLATSSIAGAQAVFTPVNSTASVNTPSGDPGCIAVTKNLTLGSHDSNLGSYSQVLALQRYLQSLGFFNVTPTGYFGSLTSNAVKAFQKSHGVPATGYVGALTRAQLKICSDIIVNPGPASSIKVTNPTAGQILIPTTQTTISWTDSNTYIQAQKYDITLVPKSPCEGRSGPCPLLLIQPYTIATSTMMNNGYSWIVGTNAQADRTVPNGDYRINVCATGGANCAQSGLFTISTSNSTSTTNAPKISSIAPSSAKVGDIITLKGTNYTTTGNTIHFGYGIIPNVNSTDGTTITFQVPSQLNPACYYATPRCMIATVITPPATYNVSVSNINGTGNALPLVVTQ